VRILANFGKLTFITFTALPVSLLSMGGKKQRLTSEQKRRVRQTMATLYRLQNFLVTAKDL